jgi:thiol-disulfide isomerase/thioredoxin
MKAGPFVFIFAALAGVGLSAAQIPWRTDSDAALNESRDTGKLLMIDFFTEWCGWCKELDKKTYTDPAVIELSGSFVSLKLDAEKSPRGRELAQRYGVSGFPTIVFLEPDGTLVGRIVGFLPAPDFALRMKKVSQYRTAVRERLAELKAGRYANSAALLSMLVELDRVREIAPIYDDPPARAALTAEQGQRFGLLLAESFTEDGDFRRALGYAEAVEKIDAGSQAAYAARLVHSVAIFGSGDGSGALTYLDGLISNAKTPDDWKARYREMKSRMQKAAQGQ